MSRLGCNLLVCLSIFVFCCSNLVFPFDVSVRKNLGSKVYLDVFLDFGEVVDKDSLRISVDSPTVVIEDWHVEQEFVEEYLIPLKLHKKLYKDSFVLQVVLNSIPSKDCSLYLSCFVVEDDERVVSCVKKVLLRVYDGASLYSAVLQEEDARPVIRRSTLGCCQVVSVHKVVSCRNAIPFWLLNAKYFFFLLIALIFIGFIIVDILSFFDVMWLLIPGVWWYIARCVISYFFVVLVLAIWMFLLSVWYFKNAVGCSEAVPDCIRIVRTILGLLCASSVLLLLIQAYLELSFS